MHDTGIVSKKALYRTLVRQAEALVEGEPALLANLANVSALLYLTLPEINWVGFYLRQPDGTLVLGPFQGKPACTRIAEGAGVCGKAAQTDEPQVVRDIHAFPGHIVCDADSRSEIVLPLHQAGAVWGVLDIDSPRTGRFGPDDAQGLSALGTLLDRLIAQSA